MNNIYIYILFFLCGIFIYYIINNIDKLEVDNEVVEPIIGGWCMCANNFPLWDSTKTNTLIAGGFDQDGSIGPFEKFGISISNNLSLNDKCFDSSFLNNYDNKWLSVGGDWVGCKSASSSCPEKYLDCLNQDNIIKLIKKYNFNGIAFDMEGCLHLDSKSKTVFEAIKNLILYIINIYPDFVFVYVGGDYLPYYNNYLKSSGTDKLFTYIAPMLYWGDTTYQMSYNTTNIDNTLNTWTDNGWLKKQIILTFQTISAAGGCDHLPNKNCNPTLAYNYRNNNNNITKGKRILDHLIQKYNEDGYIGFLGWPPIYENNIDGKDDSDYCIDYINSNINK